MASSSPKIEPPASAAELRSRMAKLWLRDDAAVIWPLQTWRLSGGQAELPEALLTARQLDFFGFLSRFLSSAS